MNFMPPNQMLKNGKDSTFFIMYILPHSKPKQGLQSLSFGSAMSCSYIFLFMLLFPAGLHVISIWNTACFERQNHGTGYQYILNPRIGMDGWERSECRKENSVHLGRTINKVPLNVILISQRRDKPALISLRPGSSGLRSNLGYAHSSSIPTSLRGWPSYSCPLVLWNLLTGFMFTPSVSTYTPICIGKVTLW